MIAAHGGVIDIAAARRCGAAAPTADSASPAVGGVAPAVPARRPRDARELRSPRGARCFDRPSSRRPATSRSSSRLIEAQTVVRVALTFAGSVDGRVSSTRAPRCSCRARPRSPRSRRTRSSSRTRSRTSRSRSSSSSARCACRSSELRRLDAGRDLHAAWLRRLARPRVLRRRAQGMGQARRVPRRARGPDRSASSTVKEPSHE